MAESKTIIISEYFSMQYFMDSFVDIMTKRGYHLTTAAIQGGATAYISKNETGISNLLGLGLGLRVNFTVSDNILTLSFSDEKWNEKIICLILGFICCLVPMITGLIGGIKQSELPNEIYTVASSIISQ